MLENHARTVCCMAAPLLGLLLPVPSSAANLDDVAKTAQLQIKNGSLSAERLLVQRSLGKYSPRENSFYQWAAEDQACFLTRDFYENKAFRLSFDLMPVKGQTGGFQLHYCGPGRMNYIWTFAWPNLQEGLWYRILVENSERSHSVTVAEPEGNRTVWQKKDIPHAKADYGVFQFWAHGNGGYRYKNIRLPKALCEVYDKRDEFLEISFPEFSVHKYVPLKPFLVECAEKEAILKAVQEMRKEEAAIPPERQEEIQALGDAQITADSAYWYLKNPSLSMAVQKKTGAVSRLTSLQPHPLDILPPTNSGLLVYVWNKRDNWWTPLNVVTARKTAIAVEDGTKSLKLTMELAPDDASRKDLFNAKSEFILLNDYIVNRFTINVLRDDPDDYEVAYLQFHVNGDWEKQIIPHHVGDHMYVKPARVLATHRYQDELWDRSRVGHEQRCRFPIVAMEREDRFWLWGGLDLNGFTVITTNVADSMPAFTITPKGLKAGRPFRFECVHKTFTKPQKSFGDLFKWYAQHVYSTHPLSKGLVRLPKNRKPRVVPEGNPAFHLYSREWIAPEHYDPAYFEKYYENLKRMHVSHLWYTYWWRWNYTYPTEGKWLNETNNWITADSLKREISWLTHRELRPYMYFRQMWEFAGTFDDRPPYRRWLFKDKFGDYFFAYPKHDLAPVRKDELGIPRNQYVLDGSVYMNFNNKEFCDWLIGQIKLMVETYDPAGICWDMGWGDIWQGACSAEPQGTGVHHGGIYVMATVYKWLKENHPDKYVVVNACFGSPSHLWCDLAMFENAIYAINPYTLQAAQAYGTVLGNFNYPASYQHAGKNWQTKHKQAMMRILAQGVGAHTRGYDSFEYDGSMEKGPSGWIWRFEAGTHMPAMEDFWRFSAKTYNTPLVTDHGSIFVLSEEKSDNSTRPAESASQIDNLIRATYEKGSAAEKLFAAHWAGKDRYLLAAFNDSDKEKRISIIIDNDRVAEYGFVFPGEFRFQVLGSDGLLKQKGWVHQLVHKETYTVLQGALGSNEELLGVSMRK